MADEELWKKLTAEFGPDEVEIKPQPYKKDSPRGKCDVCGGTHGLPALHLDFVGHARLTMRLNSVVGPDGWSWEPFAIGTDGLPAMGHGGLWIRLTILGVTKIGFGDAPGQSGGTATKEIIGDALRNAAMRFGIATYLWSKSERERAKAAREGADQERDYDYAEATSKPDALAEAKAEAFAAARSLKLTNEEMIAEWQVWDDGGHPGTVTDPAKFVAFAAHLKSSMPAAGTPGGWPRNEGKREEFAQEMKERADS